MHCIHLVYDVPGWAHERRADALAKYAPADFRVTSGHMRDLPADWSPFDAVLLLPYGLARDVRRQIDRLPGRRPLLVIGYNCGVGYRRERFEEIAQAADHVVVNNRANYDALGRPANVTWISNGVDLEVFHPARESGESSESNSSDSSHSRALSVGSVYHRRANDDLKGMGLLRSIAPQLTAAGVQCDFREVDSVRGPKLAPADMAAWYRTGTIYVVASRYEGTPNPALEAAACGCTLVATAVGNMPELVEPGVNGLLVDRTPETLLAGILRAAADSGRLRAAMQRSIRSWDWRLRAALYFDLFRRLLAPVSSVGRGE